MPTMHEQSHVGRQNVFQGGGTTDRLGWCTVREMGVGRRVWSMVWTLNRT